ncbi:ADP-ribosylglycohydrolase family protein [Sulfitobacter sp. R18_1]|nr:ADP-ribosylglycohydrolase family protein [Sulfitobacter sp. R18_1]
MALEGWTKAEIKNAISRIYGYDLERTPDEVRERYYFEVSCQKTVPEAIICFLHCENYEDTIKTAISLGGDADTVACIAGGIAGAYYQKIPGHLYKLINEKLTPDLMEDVRWFEHEYKGRTYQKTSPDDLDTWVEPDEPAYNPAAGEHEKYMAEMDKIEGFLATQRPIRKPIWTRWAGLLRRTLRL